MSDVATRLGLDTPKVLCSYHFYRAEDMLALQKKIGDDVQIFSDSGAFSAYNAGAEVQLDGYVDWLNRNAGAFSVYVNLDVIRNPEASAANLAAMEETGLKPIPVFHIGSPMEILDRLADSYPYIALGGMVGVEEATAFKWAATCFKLVGNRSKFHGFGQTRIQIMRALPWYSVDSSSWGAGHRFGQVSVFMNGQLVRLKLGEPIMSSRVRDKIAAYGFDPSVVSSRGHYAYAARISALAWRELEADLIRDHGHFRLYLAEGSSSIVPLVNMDPVQAGLVSSIG
jgi:hypothetical protein